MNIVRRTKAAYIVISALAIVLGVSMICLPDASAELFCYILGGFTIAFGIIRIIGFFTKDLYSLAFQFDLALGIFSLLAGIILILHPQQIVALFNVVVGLFILLDSVFRIQTALDARQFGLDKWWLMLMLAIITCAVGLFVVLFPFASIRLAVILTGISFIIEGMQSLWIGLYTIRTMKKNASRSTIYIDHTED